MPVTGSGLVVADDDEVYPCVVLDVDGRPDVTDLARVHALDGIGDLRTEATILRDRVLLTISSTTPVRSSFVVDVAVPEHREVLERAAQLGRLLLATTDPAESIDGATWLAVDVDGSSLRQALSGG